MEGQYSNHRRDVRSRGPSRKFLDRIEPSGSGLPPSTEVSQSTASLQSKLRELPLVRPEQTAQAQALVAEEKYPPNDVLDRIAVLLAIRMKT